MIVDGNCMIMEAVTKALVIDRDVIAIEVQADVPERRERTSKENGQSYEKACVTTRAVILVHKVVLLGTSVNVVITKVGIVVEISFLRMKEVSNLNTNIRT